MPSFVDTDPTRPATRRPRAIAARVAALGAMLAVLFSASPAPADIQEQRARLPPAATGCTDPVEGTWLGHDYAAHQGLWYIFRLTVRRQPAGSETLVGDIHADMWNGDPHVPNPPPCGPGLLHDRIYMSAVGAVHGNAIRFGGVSWAPEPSPCGPGGYDYNPDQFSGTIDPAILEFQSVNNDGGALVNEPTVFRRIHCLDGNSPEGPRPIVRPPSFYPPRRSAGCGCAAPGA